MLQRVKYVVSELPFWIAVAIAAWLIWEVGSFILPIIWQIIFATEVPLLGRG